MNLPDACAVSYTFPEAIVNDVVCRSVRVLVMRGKVMHLSFTTRIGQPARYSDSADYRTVVVDVDKITSFHLNPGTGQLGSNLPDLRYTVATLKTAQAAPLWDPHAGVDPVIHLTLLADLRDEMQKKIGLNPALSGAPDSILNNAWPATPPAPTLPPAPVSTCRKRGTLWYDDPVDS